MSRLPRPCIGVVVDGVHEPCGDVIPSGSRCARHAKAYQESRRAPASVRYGPGYQARRAAVLAPNADGSPRLCELLLKGCTLIATTADHVIPVSRGGIDSPLVPACAHCNSSRGNRNVQGSPGAGLDVRDTRESRGPSSEDPGEPTLMPDGSTYESWRGRNH